MDKRRRGERERMIGRVTSLLAAAWLLCALHCPTTVAAEPKAPLPLSFEANVGQFDPRVRFASRGEGYTLLLTSNEAVLTVQHSGRDKDRRSPGTQERQDSPPAVLRMRLVGADTKAHVTGLEELPGKVSYFIGRDPAQWHTNVPTYARVRCRDVYPGIDVFYYGSEGRLEYDFVVAPHSDPRAITFVFQGADRLEIDHEGALVLHTARGDIRQPRPVIYQEQEGTRREIAGRYVLRRAPRVSSHGAPSNSSAPEVGFAITTYDRTKPLIIDPVIIVDDAATQ